MLAPACANWPRQQQRPSVLECCAVEDVWPDEAQAQKIVAASAAQSECPECARATPGGSVGLQALAPCPAAGRAYNRLLRAVGRWRSNGSVRPSHHHLCLFLRQRLSHHCMDDEHAAGCLSASNRCAMGLFSRIRGPSAAHPSGVADATAAPSVHTPLRKTRSILHRAASASPRVTRKPVSSSLDRADSAAGSQGASAVNKRHSVPGAGLHRLFSVRRSHRRRQQDAPAQKSSDMLEPLAQSPVEEDPAPAASPNPVLDDPPKLPSLDMGGNNVQSSSPALLEGESAGRETPSNQLPAQPSVASLFSQRAVQDLRLRDPGLDSVHAETARKQYELQSFLKQCVHHTALPTLHT